MRHSKKHNSLVEILALAVPVLLIAPNIGLDITEEMSIFAKIVNIIFPLSVYALIMSIWQRTGIITLCLIPMMAFAGFQIVLLYLYGGSIIGVDMFLNVVTTSVAEVNELLGNLMIAIGVILLLYLPPIIIAIVTICRKQFPQKIFMSVYRRLAVVFFIFSLLLTAGAWIVVPGYSPANDLYPVNIFDNLVRAFSRTGDLANYTETSKDYSFGAVSNRADSIVETYVVVIGETSRAANWQLAGYDRNTNPNLSCIDRVVFFPKAITQSNTTHKSVPMMISDLTAETFSDINSRKSILTAFKEAGFETAFFSNQRRNRSYTEYFGNEANSTYYIPDYESGLTYDSELVSMLKNYLKESNATKRFIILHTYGSHFNYRDRYPAEKAVFIPDDFADANKSNRQKLINAFDNTIINIDANLAELISTLESVEGVSAMIYAPDHGEDIYDDNRNRFLHASPTPTYWQLHVPFVVWTSDSFDDIRPDTYNTLKKNGDRVVSPSVSIFHTVLDLAGLSTSKYFPELSVASESLKNIPLLYLTDRNNAVNLITEAGIKSTDKEKLFEKGFMRE